MRGVKTPWYQVSKSEYNFLRRGKKYVNSELQAVIKGLVGEERSEQVYPSYYDGTWTLFKAAEGYQESLVDSLNQFIKTDKDRIVIPVIQARGYWLGQRAHATLLCLEKTDRGIKATYYDPKSYFGYDVDPIRQQVEDVFGPASFSVDYLGVQRFYNDTDCGMHVAQIAKNFIKHQPIKSDSRITQAVRQSQFAAMPEDKKNTYQFDGPQGWSAKGFWRHYKNPILMTAAVVGLVLAGLTVLALTKGLALPFIVAGLAKLQLGLSGALGVSVAAGLAGSAGAAAAVLPVATYSAFGACLFGGKQVRGERSSLDSSSPGPSPEGSSDGDDSEDDLYAAVEAEEPLDWRGMSRPATLEVYNLAYLAAEYGAPNEFGLLRF